ncbi:MBL fold metallo-hydrolase [Sulfurovum sp. NBC37-1]|uniref:MBL fold metallo-hydrolase n=1 Tax=Sulfurovum sp. (strain NBC37-1) TaxID=387093 RepID=UPI0001587912|nr:MBL fold metallo-hydrolase [Sulfurovum sp. NBC37-1]BAF72032.1 conserved hypothetical protein [Sulfurovum sp. NBC37-1]
MKTYRNGKFSGKYDSSVNLNFLQILRWKLFNRTVEKKEIVPLETVDRSKELQSDEDFICWLSHASFLVQLGGKRILIDPVFGDIPFYKRQIPDPYSIETLGKIDYLLISHTHYDHFDKASLKEVLKQKPQAIVPLKMSKLLKEIDPEIQTVELDWYKSVEEEGLKFTLVPAKHWGRRGPFDKNTVLWGGYVLEWQWKSIYFSGDTAAGDHFEEIGKRFDIDVALLPIGAYKPEFIMKYNHLNPQEAFNAFEQLGANKMIPMHYGTFKLTDEPLDEPLQWIEKIADAHPDTVVILKPGEVFNMI